MLGIPPPDEPSMTIPARGESHSPVRSITNRAAPVSSNSVHRVPSRTFVRPVEPYSLLEFPELRHPRVKLGIRVSSPLFMGGGTVEGRLEVTIGRSSDKKKQYGKAILLGRIGVDVIGVEEVPPARKSIFLTLATELIDISHPPPATMLAPAAERIPSAQFWTLMSSTSMLPFRLNLPLNVGPGPFHSNRAKIRYILCATALIKEAGRQSYVRCAQEINLVSAYDPERALVSLPSPLTVSDGYVLRRGGGTETLKVTAGIHRQVWVSGTTIFVDVFIANNSYKKVRSLTLQLVRWIGGYKHLNLAGAKASALTLESTASHLRVPDWKEERVIKRNVVRAGRTGNWKGVKPYSSDILTCEVEVPRGHLSVRMGRYFEVRYFVGIYVESLFTKLVHLQLPVTIIHMNSLDVVPNSLGQVSSAIEGRRALSSSAGTARRSGSVQGRAFSAPRKHSVTRLLGERVSREEMDDLTQALDESPRKMRKASSLGNRETTGKEGSLLEEEDVLLDLRRALSLDLTAPRIQASTSGLVFADEDDLQKEVDLWSSRSGSNSRKVILGKQQNEISLARKSNRAFGQEGWRNVAAEDSYVFSDGTRGSRGGRESLG
ncbi:MAG: hypothetical protein M1839_000697 [Geoglossum umbratile]|nr:MAG: hypothetical protein M1839_000697 [Geoglossum umbratile]